MMLGGELWELTTPEHRTAGNDAGSWPTPKASAAGPDYAKLDRSKTGISLQTAVAIWPTPVKHDCINRRETANWKGDDLCSKVNKEPVKMWPTPTKAEGGKIGNQPNYGQLGLSNHPDIVGSRQRPKMEKSAKGFPTPTARDHKGAYKTDALIRADGKSRAFELLPNAAIEGRGAETVSGTLSPDWVELLMGWPMGWTSLEPMAEWRVPTVEQWQDGSWEDGIPRVGVKIPNRVNRLKAIGNGQVPQAAALAWTILTSGMEAPGA